MEGEGKLMGDRLKPKKAQTYHQTGKKQSKTDQREGGGEKKG